MTDYDRLIAYLLALVALYVLVRAFAGPLRLLGGLAVRTLVGGLCVWALGFVLSLFGLSLGLNPVTALVVGLLGAPGALLLLGLKLAGF